MYRVHVSALTSDNVPIMVYPYIQSATYFIPSDVWAVPASNVLKTLSHSFYDAWWQWISCVYYHGPLDSVPSCNHSTLVTLLQIDFFAQWPHCTYAAFLGVWLLVTEGVGDRSALMRWRWTFISCPWALSIRQWFNYGEITCMAYNNYPLVRYWHTNYEIYGDVTISVLFPFRRNFWV